MSPTPTQLVPAEPSKVPARRVRTVSGEAVRRGSHTLAECVDEIQSQVDSGYESLAASDESDQAEEDRVKAPPETTPRPPLRDRGESWSGIVTGAVCAAAPAFLVFILVVFVFVQTLRYRSLIPSKSSKIQNLRAWLGQNRCQSYRTSLVETYCRYIHIIICSLFL